MFHHTKMLRSYRGLICLTVVLLTTSLGQALEYQGLLLNRHQRRLHWLKNHDPTLTSSFVSSEFSYERHDFDANFYKLEKTLRVCKPLCDGLDLGFQVMIPLKWRETRTSDVFGLGDIEIRPSLIGHIFPTVRYALELNTIIDSASDSSLGHNALVLRPTVALRWDVSSHVNMGLNVEYNFTPFDEGLNEVRALELKFPLVYKLGDGWSTALTYKPKWYLRTHNDHHRLKLSVTRVWGEGHSYAFSFGSEVPLVEESMDLKLYSSIRWFF